MSEVEEALYVHACTMCSVQLHASVLRPLHVHVLMYIFCSHMWIHVEFMYMYMYVVHGTCTVIIHGLCTECEHVHNMYVHE